ncbi:MAG TPA: hypothetical protein VFV96_13695 [Verrucomicrobiae bacterium]|nr:hypothetical protein [Verrucomicrobiae bacterium]
MTARERDTETLDERREQKHQQADGAALEAPLFLLAIQEPLAMEPARHIPPNSQTQGSQRHVNLKGQQQEAKPSLSVRRQKLHEL